MATGGFNTAHQLIRRDSINGANTVQITLWEILIWSNFRRNVFGLFLVRNRLLHLTNLNISVSRLKCALNGNFLRFNAHFHYTFANDFNNLSVKLTTLLVVYDKKKSPYFAFINKVVSTARSFVHNFKCRKKRVVAFIATSSYPSVL